MLWSLYEVVAILQKLHTKTLIYYWSGSKVTVLPYAEWARDDFYKMSCLYTEKLTQSKGETSKEETRCCLVVMSKLTKITHKFVNHVDQDTLRLVMGHQKSVSCFFAIIVIINYFLKKYLTHVGIKQQKGYFVVETIPKTDLDIWIIYNFEPKQPTSFF